MYKLAAVPLLIILLGPLLGCVSSSEVGSVPAPEVEKVRGKPRIYRLVKSPRRGYNFDAYFWIPPQPRESDIERLLVTPNNSGTADDSQRFHDRRALRTITGNWESKLARELNVPHLIPVFPRPRSDWQYYTHSLDSDTMRISLGELERLDLQLIAMIEDVRSYLLRSHGISLKEKVLLAGFSANGTFVNRFTILHPEKVRAVTCGGINAIPILPIDSYDGTRLPYHIGTADVAEITGREFDKAAWQKVAQFIYMGSEDENDTTEYDDGFTRREARIVWNTVGKEMDKRWKNCIEVYLKHTNRAQLVTYEGIGHRPMVEDMVTFLRVHAEGEFTPINPSTATIP